jgi:hypothetical protein
MKYHRRNGVIENNGENENISNIYHRKRIEICGMVCQVMCVCCLPPSGMASSKMAKYHGDNGVKNINGVMAWRISINLLSQRL